MTLRFFYNGIKSSDMPGKLQKAYVWPRDDGSIDISARNYRRFSAEVHGAFEVHNATDSQTDYFEQDHFKVKPGHPYYNAARNAAEAHSHRYAMRELNRKAKLLAAVSKAADLKGKGYEVAAEYLRQYDAAQAAKPAPEPVMERTFADLY